MLSLLFPTLTTESRGAIYPTFYAKHQIAIEATPSDILRDLMPLEFSSEQIKQLNITVIPCGVASSVTMPKCPYYKPNKACRFTCHFKITYSRISVSNIFRLVLNTRLYVCIESAVVATFTYFAPVLQYYNQ